MTRARRKECIGCGSTSDAHSITCTQVFRPLDVIRPPFKLGDVSRLADEMRRAKPSKYRARKTVVDNIEFHSAAEARRYGELKLLEKGGYIRRLELQPVYRIAINGIHVCKVILDFRYYENGIGWVDEDLKGRDNPLSRLKRKLVEAQYGIKVRLVA